MGDAIALEPHKNASMTPLPTFSWIMGESETSQHVHPVVKPAAAPTAPNLFMICIVRKTLPIFRVICSDSSFICFDDGQLRCDEHKETISMQAITTSWRPKFVKALVVRFDL